MAAFTSPCSYDSIRVLQPHLDEEAGDEQPELLAGLLVLSLVGAELGELDIDGERELDGLLVESKQGVVEDAGLLLSLLDAHAQRVLHVVDVVLLEEVEELHQVRGVLLS